MTERHDETCPACKGAKGRIRVCLVCKGVGRWTPPAPGVHHEQRTSDVFRPEAGGCPFEMATHHRGNLRLVVRSKGADGISIAKHEINWRAEDLGAAIAFLLSVQAALCPGTKDEERAWPPS